MKNQTQYENPTILESIAIAPSGDIYSGTGISLLDYFAARIAAALVSKSSPIEEADHGKIALYAYEQALNMLSVRQTFFGEAYPELKNEKTD